MMKIYIKLLCQNLFKKKNVFYVYYFPIKFIYY